MQHCVDLYMVNGVWEQRNRERERVSENQSAIGDLREKRDERVVNVISRLCLSDQSYNEKKRKRYRDLFMVDWLNG